MKTIAAIALIGVFLLGRVNGVGVRGTLSAIGCGCVAIVGAVCMLVVTMIAFICLPESWATYLERRSERERHQ